MSTSLSTSLPKLFVAALALLVASACIPVARNHGFVASKKSPGDIEKGVDTKTTILSKFGNPSTTGTFNQEKWYYMTELREQLGYLRPRTVQRTVTAVAFNTRGVVDKVDVYSVKDGHLVSPVKRKTPTRGRELSIIQQLLGGVGRLPPGTIGGQRDLPGGAGGPRPQ